MPTSTFTVAFAALLGASVSAVDLPFFAPKDLANGSVSGLSCIDAGRINNDVYPDIVAIEGGKHAGGRKTFAWFESPSNPQGTWIRHEINASAPLRSFLGSAKLADFDHDGDLDLAVTSDNHSGATKAADVYVFLNPGGSAAGTWSYVRVTPTTLLLHHINDMEIADFDGDGRKDIAVRSLEPNQIHLFFQNGLSSWTRKTIDTGISQSEGLSVGQIDGDGRPDITFTGWWLKTPSDARNGSYTKNPIDSGYQNVNQNTKEATGDIDGDGLIDIVIGPAEAYRNGGNQSLAWYRNPGSGYGSNWVKTVIRANTNNHHTVKLADLDNDGDLDVVTGKPWSASGIAKESLIFFNSGAGGFASVQTLVSGKGLYTGVVVDIGNDGDLDIVGQDGYAGTSKPWLYENKLGGSIPPPADTQAPTPPSPLTATATGSSSIALSWTASTDNVGVTGYEISRNGTVLTTIPGTTYTSTGLAASTSYSFSVRARDAAGNWSAAVTATATTSGAAPMNPAGTWQIALRGTTQVLEIMGTVNYADLQVRPDADLDEQIWTIQPGTSAGWYEIINTGTGKALECWAKTAAEGDEMSQYTSNHLDWQQWKLTQQSDGSWRIEGKYNTRSVTAETPATGANVDARTDSGAATQRWELRTPGPAAPVGNG